MQWIDSAVPNNVQIPESRHLLVPTVTTIMKVAVLKQKKNVKREEVCSLG